MKFSKTNQKLKTKLLACLKILEGKAAQEFSGFISLSHTVQFDYFPGSLLVTCYFQAEELAQAKVKEAKYQKSLHQLLFKQGILLKNPRVNLRFCLSEA